MPADVLLNNLLTRGRDVWDTSVLVPIYAGQYTVIDSCVAIHNRLYGDLFDHTIFYLFYG
jgi:hypothetical protein